MEFLESVNRFLTEHLDLFYYFESFLSICSKKRLRPPKTLTKNCNGFYMAEPHGKVHVSAGLDVQITSRVGCMGNLGQL